MVSSYSLSTHTRIGHLDLMARRVEAASLKNFEHTKKRYDTSTNEWKELEQLIWHACYREFRDDAYDPFVEDKNLPSAASKLLELSSERLAAMVSDWIRVGFAQGNFNADNCLLGGKTMDYGPFGFLEEFNPLFAKWTGSGKHFGFLNQPSAGLANYQVLVESVVPVIVAARDINENPDKTIETFMLSAQDTFQRNVDETFRCKLGLEAESDIGDDLWQSLQSLMIKSRVDWTLFWRQLTYVARDHSKMDTSTKTDYEDVMASLEGLGEGRTNDVSPFYLDLSPELRREWLSWLEQWSIALDRAGLLEGAYDKMRKINPKFVLREWMLVDAYTSAADEDLAILQELYELIQRPYDEGTTQDVLSYYRRAPDASLTAGGTAFMS
jgi:serine/tyrosine/threonine adenylyltransferase